MCSLRRLLELQATLLKGLRPVSPTGRATGTGKSPSATEVDSGGTGSHAARTEARCALLLLIRARAPSAGSYHLPGETAVTLQVGMVVPSLHRWKRFPRAAATCPAASVTLGPSVPSALGWRVKTHQGWGPLQVLRVPAAPPWGGGRLTQGRLEAEAVGGRGGGGAQGPEFRFPAVWRRGEEGKGVVWCSGSASPPWPLLGSPWGAGRDASWLGTLWSGLQTLRCSPRALPPPFPVSARRGGP